MNLLSLINICRRRLMDTAGADADLFWPREDLVEYINAGIEEVCERANLLRDSLTNSVCLIPLVANQRHYSLHDSVLEILTVQPSWRQTPLGKQSVSTAPQGWLTDTGLPDEYLMDYSGRTLSLLSTPTTVTDEAIRLTVSRLPLVELEDDDDEPAITVRYHRRLVDGVLAKAYSKQDAETYNPRKAQSSQEDWERAISSIVRDEAKLNPRIYICKAERF